ncbi:MAG: hypothetical protein ACE5K8_08480, partial [Candidatus Zixiibacteriota bacterium]
MKHVLFLFCLFLWQLLAASLGGQEKTAMPPPEQFGLAHLTEFLGLKPDDISFRSDYTDPDSFRLKIIVELMQKPLGMIDYAAGLKNAHVMGQPEIIASILFQDLASEHQTDRSRAYKPNVTEIKRTYNLYYTDVAFNQLLTRAAKYLDVVFPKSTKMSLAALTAEQHRFLKNEFKELIVMSEEEEYMSVEAIDSLEKLEEKYSEEFVKFGTKIDKDPIVAAGIDCLRELMPEINNLRRLLQSGQVTAEKIVKGTGYIPDNVDVESYLGMQSGWKIGGPGNDHYQGDYKFIFDFSGDDIYDLSYD